MLTIRGTIKRKEAPLPSIFDLSGLTKEHAETKSFLERMKSESADVIQRAEEMIKKLEDKIALVKIQTKGDKGDTGETPVPGVHFPVPTNGEDGEDGKDGETPVVDYDLVARLAAKLVPKPKDAESISMADIMKEIKKSLRVEHIPGLKNEIESYRNQLAGAIYGKDTDIRGGGDTVAAGTGISITTNRDGKKVITSTAGALTLLPATGTVNGANTSFTFTQKPTYIISDGAWLTQLDSNGATQWSWNAGTLTATMVVPPNGSIFGIA